MDFTNHVILPREDFIELQENAWTHPPVSIKERVATTLQTTAFFAAAAAGITMATYGWAKVLDWHEERIFQRDMRRRLAEKNLSEQ